MSKASSAASKTATVAPPSPHTFPSLHELPSDDVPAKTAADTESSPPPRKDVLKPDVPSVVEKEHPSPVDMEPFTQILELDGGDPELPFTASIVVDYFNQAESTLAYIRKALAAKDLKKLQDLGHYLKGSSAQLGAFLLQSSCEKIQYYGQLRDQEKNVDITEFEALEKITAIMGPAEAEYESAKAWYQDYFNTQGVKLGTSD